MPVKIRCNGCEQVLNVPDKARGRTVACPKCNAKLKIPAGDDVPSTKPAAGENAPSEKAPPSKAKPAAKPKAARKEGEFLGGLDDYGIEDQNDSICPFCAEPIDEEDEICPGCGRDLATGQMDKREQVKRSTAGRSSSAFYKNVLKESWAFMLEYKSLALRTGGIASFFVVLYMACFFMVLYCEKMPPKVFWIAMTVVTAVGAPGWIWFLTRKIVAAHLYNEKLEADRIFYDFFTNVALGLAAFLWPAVVSLPLILALALLPVIIPTIIAGGVIPPRVYPNFSIAVFSIMGFSILVLPIVSFPIATVHMIARHQHKAWIGWELLKLVFKNIGPIMVYHTFSFLIMVTFGGIAFAFAWFFGTLNLFNNPRIYNWTASLTSWIGKFIDNTTPLEPGSFMFVIIQMPLMFGLAFLIVVPFFIALGFPLLFQMKVNGLIAKHFSHSLDLDQRIFPLTPAGFWVRFLAFTTDSCLFPLSTLIVTHNKKLVMIGMGFMGVMGAAWLLLGTESLIVTLILPIALVGYNRWMYFAGSHSGPSRATLGMEAFGLIAIPDGEKIKQKELDRPLSVKKATIRWICVELSTLTGGISFLSCAFHPQKKAIHDIVSKTRIVFEGDK